MATPVYFYTVCGQMKTLIDRCCARYTEMTDKEFYFIRRARGARRGLRRRGLARRGDQILARDAGGVRTGPAGVKMPYNKLK